MTSDSEIEAEHREVMQDIARIINQAINEKAPDKYGFFLAVYQHGTEGRFNYISNSDRRDIVVLLKEMLARFQGQPEVEGRA